MGGRISNPPESHSPVRGLKIRAPMGELFQNEERGLGADFKRAAAGGVGDGNTHGLELRGGVDAGGDC